MGNRVTRVLDGTTETYSYSPTANQIATITSGGNIRSFSYQLSGQVSRDVRDASNTYTFAANNSGRNASATLNGVTANYLYNAFEQRVQKIVGPSGSTTTTQFVYDRAGHLLLEANGSGTAQREYIWLDDVPVALVDDTGAAPVLYFIHTDQLGTPQKITDASAVVVWDGVFDPFGNAVGYAAGVWDTSKWDMAVWGGSLSLTNLRFPGQYADTEIALNQNWFRDYDPTIGRYIQGDPIGLRGGLNTYAYVENMPLRGYDFFGLIQACQANPRCSIAALRAHHEQAVARIASKYRQAGFVVTPNVTITNPETGRTAVADLVISTPGFPTNIPQLIIEVKTGGGTLSGGQSDVYGVIGQGGDIVPRGLNSVGAGFIPGFPFNSGPLEVKIDRQPGLLDCD